MVGYGAHEIQNALTANSVVLRITGDDSIVQRTSKGYTASSGTVSSDISKDQWRRLFQGRYPDWRDHDYDGADDIVNHITGGWSGYSSSAESDWISTSASLRWTIWEIARRLDRREQLSIELAVIRRKFPSGYRGAKPVRLDAADTLRLYRARTHYDHRHLVDAINFARASSEIVFYGRIFGKDVLETSSWDLDVSFLLIYVRSSPADEARGRASVSLRSTSSRRNGVTANVESTGWSGT